MGQADRATAFRIPHSDEPLCSYVAFGLLTSEL